MPLAVIVAVFALLLSMLTVAPTASADEDDTDTNTDVTYTNEATPPRAPLPSPVRASPSRPMAPPW